MSSRLLLTPNQFGKKRFLRYSLATAMTIILPVFAGCTSLAEKISLPDISKPKFSIPGNTDSFRKRFYAGANLGSSTLNPDTGSMSTAYTGSQNSGSSLIRIGYDMHNMLAMELESSVLGTATVNQAGTAEVNYSSLSASAVVYGLTGVANRSRRTGWSGFGRIGFAYNRHASNVAALDESSGGVMLGLGAEYGFDNGLAIRLEGSRYESDAFFTGLGLVYRIQDIGKYIPRSLVSRKTEEPTMAAAHSGQPRAMVYDPRATSSSAHRASVGSARAMTVTVLASASDLDGDGVHNDFDQCGDTQTRTSVDEHGCGLFDGSLEGVSFSNGSAGLDESAKVVLDTLALKLQAFPEIRVRLVGHTDNRGPEDINLLVAGSRADAVSRYLVRAGVPEIQLNTASAGSSESIADNSDPEGQMLNRRIEVVTLPNLTLEQYRESQKIAANSRAKKTPVAKVVADQKEVTNAVDQQPDPEPVLAAAMAEVDLLPESVNIPGLEVGGVMEGVSFTPGTADLTPESFAPLQKIATELKQFPDVEAAIVAHTNTLGTPEENLALTLRQSKAVSRELVRRGVNRRRLKAMGFGDKLPLLQNVSTVHQEFNRRLELRLLK